MRSLLSAALVTTVSRRLGIRVSHPDGRVVGHPDPRAPVMRLLDPAAVHRRIATGGPIGVGEAYQAGEWDATDLPGLLTTMAMHLRPPRWVLWLRRAYGERGPASERNTVDNATHNISRHYDLSNDFFAQYLDETMTYSSAMFRTDAAGRPLPDAEPLAEAQLRKIGRVLDLADVGPGTRLLEIGSGWGALAVVAARRGAHVHTITISRAQWEYARRRFVTDGVSDRVTIELCDYREVRARHGDYDAIVSVEMLEAVGEEYWPLYFRTLQRLLAPHGRAVLQVITTPHAQMLANRRKYTWIHKYIFPGGLIPSVRALEEACRRHTALRTRVVEAFGAHYAASLRLWRERLAARETEVLALGFDRVFLRTWELYLAYCEAGFRSGLVDVNHILVERSA